MTQPRRTSWRGFLWPEGDTVFGAIVLVLVLVLVAAFWNWSGRHPGYGTAELETCRALYTDARSGTDSARVDQMRPRQGRRAQLTCGAMRSAGSLVRDGTAR